MPAATPQPLLFRIAPGLRSLLAYKFGEDFSHDLIAGVSVAAVALPVAIAYAELAGFPPEVGLYSSILPLVAYAIFGTSRQLMVNPDAAACAMVASAVAPLAVAAHGHGGTDPHLYASLSIILAMLAGVLCIVASFFRLGALADFLSKPILVGFLNGIAISIFLGQIGKMCGFAVRAGGIIPRIVEIAEKIQQTHGPTLAVAAGAFAVLFLSKKFLPHLPSALIAMVVAGAAVALFKLDSHGVAILGKVRAGLPKLDWPNVPLRELPTLAADAAGMALVLFTSGMLTARSFAAKGGYDIDVDKEFAAFGVANIASALSQGFAVTGADSRTAMAQAAGGRTQVTGLVAAAAIAIVLMFLTAPLRYVPVAALGAVLIFAAFSLFDTRTLRDIWKIDKGEVALSIVTTLGVVGVGAINAILLAVALALVRFVRMTARPRDEVLGTIEGMPGFHSIDRHKSATTTPGLVMYRFGSPITFFNSAYFQQLVLALTEPAHAPAIADGPSKWVVLDAIPISYVDVTGLYAVRELRQKLKARGVELILAGRKTEYTNWLRQCGLFREEDEQIFYPTLRQAYRAFLDQRTNIGSTAVAEATPSR